MKMKRQQEWMGLQLRCLSVEEANNNNNNSNNNNNNDNNNSNNGCTRAWLTRWRIHLLTERG